MFDLSGKTALVTGASGGIGAAIACDLAGAGATVALSGTRVDALEAVAAGIEGTTHIVPGNLGEDGGAEAVLSAAETASGGIDILVNNAGITRDQLAMRLKDEDWDAVLSVNLTAGFKATRAALRGMMKRRFGRIVSITSVVGQTGNPGQTNYAAAKAGTVGMSKALAQEVASRGITVNCVAPGFIDTAMTQGLDDAQKEKLLAAIPAGRLGTPEDVSAAVVFLASDQAAYITGATLHVNGGMAMV